MAKKKVKNEGLPGLAVEPFRAAVDTLAKLCNEGKFFIFFPRKNSVRLNGNDGDFQKAFAARLNEEVSDDKSKDALSELRNWLGSMFELDGPEPLMAFLKNQMYSDNFEARDEAGKAELAAHLRVKCDLIATSFFSNAIKERKKRFRTATGPCIEELDIEVIESRKDEISQELIDEPFVRLRLRYSDSTTSDGGFSAFFPFPRALFPGTHIAPVQSFEIECDASDIALLMLRLEAARKSLAIASDKSEQKPNA